jgi:hypothetical protein
MAISLECSCGRKLKVDEKHRGKKAKCPGCGTTLLVEEPDDDVDPETAMQAEEPKKRPTPVDDDEDEPEVRKPIKKKKAAAKSSMITWLLAGGCGLLVLLGCCTGIGGVGVWYFFFRGGDDDLKYVHEGVAGFVSVRTADIWKSSVVQDQLKQLPPAAKKEMDDKLKEFETQGSLKIDDIERVTIIFRSTNIMNLDFAAVMKTSKAMDRKKVVAAMAKDKNLKEKEVKHEQGTIYVLTGAAPMDSAAIFFPSDKVVLFGQKEETIKDILRQAKKPAKHAALTRGIQMASSGKHQLVVAFELKKDLMANIPPDAKKMAPNLAETNGLILAGTLAKDLALEAVLTFATQDVAAKAKTETDNFVGMGRVGAKGQNIPAAFGKFMDSVAVEQRGVEVVVKANLELDLKGFGNFPGFPFGGGPGPGLGGPGRVQSTNNLKQIALAMHNFHDANKGLPNHAIRHPKTGDPLLSWRVAILPYIEQLALYQQIKLDERWDSPHNRKFWNQMPAVYQMPGKPNNGMTYYQVFHGDRSAFPRGMKPFPNFPPMKGDLNFAAIHDGTTDTILAIEAANPVNWMEPRDIPFQMGQFNLLPHLGNHWGDDTFQAAMIAGNVRTMRRTMTPQTLQALITRNGGEIVNDKDWEPRR